MFTTKLYVFTTKQCNKLIHCPNNTNGRGCVLYTILHNLHLKIQEANNNY